MRGRKPEGLGSADRKPFRGFDSYWTGCASQSEKQRSRAKQSETGGWGGRGFETLPTCCLESVGPLLRWRGSGSESLWSKVIPGQFSRLAVRAAYPHYLSHEKADESLRPADFFEGGC